MTNVVMDDLSERIIGLYHSYPEARETLLERYSEKDFFAVKLKQLQELGMRDVSLDTLELYDKHLRGLVQLLSPFSLDQIAEHFDESIGWWLFAKEAEHGDAMQRIFGYNRDLLEKARCSAWQLVHCNNDSRLVKRSYELFRSVINQESLPEVVPRLSKYVHPGRRFVAGQVDRYDTVGVTTCNSNARGWIVDDYRWDHDDTRYIMFLDAPVGVVLTYDDQPCAMVGVAPVDLETLMIFQLQGVSPRSSELDGSITKNGDAWGVEPFDWQRLLVDYVGDIGKVYGYSRLAIQAGEYNYWLTPRKGKQHLTFEQAEKKYDKVAQRLGFVQGHDKNWYRMM
ncbi:MAG: hypothetical protein Q7R96_04960 [Nanoarchaeota archaeon]|nr:hypothetical protein [Nanoarchaeota archaeon]